MSGSSNAILGEIRLFAGNYAPRGWALCDGQLRSCVQESALFSLIGKTYGGNGQTNFALPDLRGRLPVGQGQGEEPRLTPRTMGDQFGVESVALTVQQSPAHSHDFATTTAAAENASPAGALFADTGDDLLYVSSPAPQELKAMNPKTIASAGAGQPHENIMSSLAINYIISTDGIYPQRT